MLVLKNESIALDDFVSYDTKNEVYKVEIIGDFSEPTLLQFGALNEAFKYFNENLFDNKLPLPVLVLCKSLRKSYGSYSYQTWIDNCGNKFDQININPKFLSKSSAKEIYSTLVHEMVHLWQFNFTDKTKNGYHDKQFAQAMLRIGLQTSNTGEIGGKTTGQRMSDYILEDGKFAEAFSKMPKKFVLPFIHSHFKGSDNVVTSEVDNIIVNAKNKVKYRCPSCEMAVWGKSNLKIECMNCKKMLLAT